MLGTVIKMMNRTYSELILLPTFEERFEYLKLSGSVGRETFGYNRYLNQVFYRSSEWRRFRRDVIARDSGCDLACEGFELYDSIVIHHINPITVDDVMNRSRLLFDLDNVICTSDGTHKAIHYGDITLIATRPTVRTKYDTCPWKQ